MLEASEKKVATKKKPNMKKNQPEILKLKKYSNRLKSLMGRLTSRMEKTEENSMNLKTEQQKLPDLNRKWT